MAVSRAHVVFIYPKMKYLFEKDPLPPMGVAYLGAAMRDAGYTVRCIDGMILPQDDYERRIEQIRDEIVCISMCLVHYGEAKRISGLVRKNNPHSTIIIGGPGIRCIKDEDLFRDFPADFFVRGEAERVLPRLVENIGKGDELRKLPGVTFRDTGQIVNTGLPVFVENIDELPSPDWKMMNLPDYFQQWRSQLGATCVPMITGRGCWFSCAFCDKGFLGNKVRLHSIDRVVNEIQSLVDEYKPDVFFFVDDLFLVNQKRVWGILKELRERNLKINWVSHARPDTLNRALVQEIHETGCLSLLFGLESGSPRILKYLNKGFSPDQLASAFELCHEFGIAPRAYVIVGVPGTTHEDIELTKQLIKRAKPASLSFSYLTPYPGTPLYERLKDKIVVTDYSEWDDYRRSPLRNEFEIDPVNELHELIEFYANDVAPDSPVARELLDQFLKDPRNF